MPEDDIGRTLERALIEIEHLRATCRTSQDLKAVEARAKSAEDLLAVYKAQVEQQKALNQTRAEVDVLNTARIADYEKQLKSYEARVVANKTQIEGLKRDRAHLRKMRNVFAGIAVALLVGIGCAAAR